MLMMADGGVVSSPTRFGRPRPKVKVRSSIPPLPGEFFSLFPPNTSDESLKRLGDASNFNEPPNGSFANQQKKLNPAQPNRMAEVEPRTQTNRQTRYDTTDKTPSTTSSRIHSTPLRSVDYNPRRIRHFKLISRIADFSSLPISHPCLLLHPPIHLPHRPQPDEESLWLVKIHICAVMHESSSFNDCLDRDVVDPASSVATISHAA